MARMIEVVIDSVRVSLTNQQRIVVLRELDSERYLSIWIGPYEAEAITIALQDVEVARPQTHDLLKNTLSALNARLVRVEVVALKEDVYYGNLVVEADNRLINIDSRPSDALALAVRLRIPIYVSKDVMDAAGAVPESDLQNQDPLAPSAPPGEPAESEERLSVFEDFLENLSMDEDDSSKSGTEPEEDDPQEGK